MSRVQLTLMKHADRLSFGERAERELSIVFSVSLPFSLSLVFYSLSSSSSPSSSRRHHTAFRFEYRKQLFVSCLRFNRRPRRALLSAEASANVVSSQSAYSAFYSGYLTPTDVKFRPSLETPRKICPLNNPESFPEIFRIAKIFPACRRHRSLSPRSLVSR